MRKLSLIRRLNLLLEEFEENRCLLNIIKTNITAGPPIKQLMKPAEIISKYLRFKAWDELVESGLLKIISDEQLRIYKLADRRTRDVARIIQTENSKYIRILEWNTWDKQNNTMQPFSSPSLFLNQALSDSCTAIDKAVASIDLALINMKEEQLI